MWSRNSAGSVLRCNIIMTSWCHKRNTMSCEVATALARCYDATSLWHHDVMMSFCVNKIPPMTGVKSRPTYHKTAKAYSQKLWAPLPITMLTLTSQQWNKKYRLSSHWFHISKIYLRLTLRFRNANRSLHPFVTYGQRLFAEHHKYIFLFNFSRLWQGPNYTAEH